MSQESKTVQEWQEAIASVFVSESKASTLSAETLKQRIAAGYDRHSDTAIAGLMWNWGMHNEDIYQRITARVADFDKYNSDGHSEQLYFYAFDSVPRSEVKKRKILEVGSGQGLGLNFLSRFETGSTFTGVDLSSSAVKSANAQFARPGSLEYVHGDAENLPFDSNEFDVVINVESSHNYPNLRKFLSEVARVLRPGGFLSHVDMFTDSRLASMETCKRETAGLCWLMDSDISEYVRAAIRRRMDPTSLFAGTFERAVSLPDREAVIRRVMRHYGSSFVASSEDPKNPLSFVTSYRHMLARKGSGAELHGE